MRRDPSQRPAPRWTMWRPLCTLVLGLALVAGAVEVHGPGVDHGWPAAPSVAQAQPAASTAGAQLASPVSVERGICHACLHRLQTQGTLDRARGLTDELPARGAGMLEAAHLRRPAVLSSWSPRGPPRLNLPVGTV